MATISISTLDYYTINDFSFSTAWEIPHGSSKTLFFVITKSDNIDTRRFIPVLGTVVTLNFMRQRTVNNVTSGNTSAQTVSKIATLVDPRDSSLYQIQLSGAETSTIITGGVQLVLTTNGNTESYMIPYKVKKILSSAGC
jgi:hypothetical protein